MLKKNDDKHLKINLCLKSVTGKLDSGCCCFSQSFWKDFKFSVATLSNVNGHSTKSYICSKKLFCDNIHGHTYDFLWTALSTKSHSVQYV